MIGEKLAAIAGVVVLSLTACGGESSASEATSPGRTATSAQTPSTSSKPSSEPTPDDKAALKSALKSAVQAYSDAYLADEPVGAYDLLSHRCRKRMSLSSFTRLSMAANERYGAPLPVQTFKADIQGNRARVTYTYGVQGINRTRQTWVMEHGTWHEDAC